MLPDIHTEKPAPPTDDNSRPQDDPGRANSPKDINDEIPDENNDMDIKDVVDTVTMKSVLRLPGLMRGRDDAGRKRAIGKNGGPGGEDKVKKGLKWLAQVQDEDGSWGNQSPAHTGMALLAFLAHGETPLSLLYGNTVQKAMQWLATEVDESPTGDLGQKSYGHAIATYAISEAYGMTRIPMMKRAMEKSIAVIIYGQQENGGFYYGYDKKGKWDLSVAGWQIQALKAAYVAGATNQGLAEAITKARMFCRRTAYKNGKFGYQSPGTGGNMTGVGTVALQILGDGKCAEVKAARATIVSERLAQYKKLADDPSTWDAIAGKNLYGWYYDTQAMFFGKIEGAQGKKDWENWKKTYQKVIARHQHREGYWEVAKGHGLGSNLPGRIMATCWATLQLEVIYRYLPTARIEKMNERRVEDNIDTVANDSKMQIEIQ